MSGSALIVAYGVFIANYLFGVCVGTGLIRTGRFRFVHHLLYFLTMFSLGMVALLALWRGDGAGYLSLALFVLLLGMPRFSGGSRGHRIFATACFIFYSLLLFL